MDIRQKSPLIGVVMIAACLTAFIARVGEGGSSEIYEKEIETWRAGRLERLTSPGGYLALTGLYWLRDGENSFGSDSSNDLVFSSSHAPARMGVFHLENGHVRVEIRNGVGVLCEGELVREMTLYHDADPEHERTELVLGTMKWYAIKRGEKFGIRLKDSNSETLRGFGKIESFSTGERWRIVGKFEKYNPLKYIPITSIGDIHTNETSTGAIVFEIDGRTYRLDALAEPGDKRLFVIFADATSGLETYGAGRFLYVNAPGEDGVVTIDFNKAYNPPCAFSDFTTCPLPPPQNLLPVRVTAGEKVYKKDKP